MPWGVAAAAAGSLISGAMASGAVGDAASSANGISQAAIQQADQLRQQNSTTFQPFVDQGTTSVGALGNILGVNGSDAASSAMSNFTGSPGYQYALQQGVGAVDAGAAAKGTLRSGATLKAEQTLGTNLADQNFNTYVGQLSGLAGLGIMGAQGQAGTTATFNGLLSPQTSNQVNTTTGAGTAQASIYGNTISGLTSGIKSSGLFNSTGTNGTPFASSYGSFDSAGI